VELDYSRQISKNTQISYIMKIRPVGAELYADRRTDRHDEANRSLFEILRKRLKTLEAFAVQNFEIW
jgi:hypothetical protein